MNGLTGLSIIAIFFLGITSTIAINNLHNNESKIEKVKKTKEVITTIKQSDIASKAVKNYISNAGYIPDINPNALNLKAVNLSDRILITKFNNAMEYAVIKENIRNPKCSDLAQTGLITLSQCNYIAHKKGLYVNIKNGAIELGKIPDTQNTEVSSFVHIVNVLSGENMPVKEESFSNAQNKKSASLEEKTDIEVPIISSVITQTINTNEATAKSVIKKRMIEKSVENINKILDDHIINRLQSKEQTDNKSAKENRYDDMKPVTNINNDMKPVTNINNINEDFENSFTPSYKPVNKEKTLTRRP